MPGRAPGEQRRPDRRGAELTHLTGFLALTHSLLYETISAPTSSRYPRLCWPASCMCGGIEHTDLSAKMHTDTQGKQPCVFFPDKLSVHRLMYSWIYKESGNKSIISRLVKTHSTFLSQIWYSSCS